MAPVSHKIKSLNLIPGSGEFTISSTVMRNQYSVPLNAIKGGAKTYIQATIDSLKVDFPNLKKVGLVLGWFGDSIDADKMTINPKVEDRNIKLGGSDWEVAEFNRQTAAVISKVDGKVNWGGTYTDRSVIEACELLHQNGYEVMLYPMLYLDLPKKPWRGEVKAKTDKGVDNFFIQYNKFIKHYATLQVGGKKITDFIKVFVVGSELKALTAYKSDVTQQFKVVDKLIDLSKDVKALLGKDIKVTYAADWSEYHHIDGGLRPLDKLWANENIDFVGIDAYFPLTDEVEKSGETYEVLKKGWENGVNYDYYRDWQGNKVPLSPEWGIKNVKHWHETYHFSDGKRTDWCPKIKNITFTEFGCASVEGCSSRPYFFEYGKDAKVNFEVQARVLEATLDYWKDESTVSDIYIYAVDVRTDYQERPDMFADAGNDANHNVKVASIEMIGDNCGNA